MNADEWDFEPPEREHDCCPRCGRGSCPGSGSLGWDGCEDPTWTAADRCHACGGPSARRVCGECRYWATLEGAPARTPS